ncbi:MAG: 2-succinyl-6-hydroxy-2,4-cyclohexadiene-1-carboxylate synthase [Rhodothermales bacterium]
MGKRTKLHYIASGRNQMPAVLFLHGFMGSGDDWTGIIDGLEGNYCSLVVDLPGHGASTKGEDDAWYTIEGTARALCDLLDERGIERCALVGYSMGGRVALYFALHYPERCSKLMLESASPGLATREEREVRRREDEKRAHYLEQGNLEAFLNDWYRQSLFASLTLHDGLVERMIASRCRNDRRELARSLRGMGTGSQPSLWEGLSTLPVSTLVVAGALDAKYVAIARRMERLGAQIRAAVVPDAGHNVHVEVPAVYLDRVHTFLKQR